MNEKDVIQMLAKPIETHTSDYKCFIGERRPQNHVEYDAVVAVIVPIPSGEQVMKEIMKHAPALRFKGSQVESPDHRGVDILLFETKLRYDGRYDNAAD